MKTRSQALLEEAQHHMRMAEILIGRAMSERTGNDDPTHQVRSEMGRAWASLGALTSSLDITE